MTPRSPKQHHKSTTISRRLRLRAQQNLSVQPPESLQLRSVRPRRAATLPEPHLDTLQIHHQLGPIRELHLRDNSHSLETSQRQQGLLHSPHTSPQGSSPGPTVTEQLTAQNFRLSPFSVFEYPPSPLPSVSGSLDFEASLPSTNHQQPHNPLINFQDMRYAALRAPCVDQFRS